MGAKEPNKRGNGQWTSSRNPFARAEGDRPNRAPLRETPELLAAIDVAVAAGCAVLIGGTRDGGAYCITILDGDERHRTYCHTQAELHDAAQALMQLYS